MQRFCYFHIPKSAGTSFTQALGTIFSVSPPFVARRRMDEITARDIGAYTLTAGHLSYDDYIRWFRIAPSSRS
jgi:hypothetical protein